MSQIFAHQLGLKIWKTNVGARKIDSTTLKTYGMIVSTFFILDKDDRERFFEENFLLANIKLDIMLEILFLTMSNTDIDFYAQNLQWKSYTTRDVFPITRRVKLIGKKEFVGTALDPDHEAFVIYIVVLNVDSGNKMHPSRRAQIAYLKVDEASTKVLSEYADFVDIFSPKLVAELLEHTEISNHAIKLVDDWQLL